MLAASASPLAASGSPPLRRRQPGGFGVAGSPDDEPLALPDAPPPFHRTPLPLLAAVVPVVGAVGLWAVTGSVLSLWFAALGPLIAVATLLDGVRAARRESRRRRREGVEARTRVLDEIARRHDRERARLAARHPDVLRLLSDDEGVWRSGGGDSLVVGRGPARSAVRVTGGVGDDDAAGVRAVAGVLREAPVTVPLLGGIAVVGPAPVAAAVVRALAVQACLLHPPGALRVVGPVSGDAAWSAELPHRRAREGRTLAVGAGAAQADAAIVRVEPGAAPPPGCAAVLTLASVSRATLTCDGESTEVTVECLGETQAAAVAADLAARAGELFPAVALPPIALAALLPHAPAAERGALAAVIGVADETPATLDLVADGPHAVVAGVTGSGKSELLITWVTALCAAHSPDEVRFLLADFKGGTAFDALRALPHVTGVLTDLDGGGARRALESLRAEVRRREAELARAGARDVLDPRSGLARLVVVVDEFAALLGDHPELQSLFTDLAARGRALGIHLVLGTQRVSGIVRDALLANCPLRISLRVTDAADSRAVIGTDEAARLAGGAESRGVAFVRRGSDAVPHRLRVALTDPTDIAAVVASAAPTAAPPPWLPSLPPRVELARLALPPDAAEGSLLLGLCDQPERQRQVPALLGPRERGLAVVGRAGAGRSTALAAIAAQVPARLLHRVPRDLEQAWDEIARLEHGAQAGAVVIVDDLDALLAAFPLEHSQPAAERIERLVRSAGDSGMRVVVSLQRLTGQSARIAELLPRRAILALPTRADHVIAAGDGALYDRDAPPGRAELDGWAVQLACAPGAAPAPEADPAPAWLPPPGLTGFVTRRAAAVAEALRARRVAVVAVDEAVAMAESPRAFDAPVVVVGDAETWQRSWRVLGAIRAEHDLVIDASFAADYRALTADREPPPYCRPHADRAWLLSPGAPPRRVRIVVARPDGEA